MNRARTQKDGTAGTWYADAGKNTACGTTVDGSTVTTLYSTFCVKPVSGWDGSTADTTWCTGHESETSFTINTEAALARLSSLVNAGTTDFEGDTITLSFDIDLAGHAWTPIGTTDHSFKGTFDGGDVTITGLAIGTSASPDSTAVEAGLLGCTGTDASIQTVSIVNAADHSSAASALVSGLVGNNAGDIAGCSVSGSIETMGKKTCVGAVAGNSIGIVIFSSGPMDTIGASGSGDAAFRMGIVSVSSPRTAAISGRMPR